MRVCAFKLWFENLVLPVSADETDSRTKPPRRRYCLREVLSAVTLTKALQRAVGFGRLIMVEDMDLLSSDWLCWS